MKEETITKELGVFKVSLEDVSELHDVYCQYFNIFDQATQFHHKSREIVDHLAKIVDFKKNQITIETPESTAEIQQKYDPKFLSDVLQFLSDKNYRVHATTSLETVKKIFKKGLQVDSPGKDIEYTTQNFNNLTDNEMLDNLCNHMHRYQKQIVIVDAQSNNLKGTEGHYVLPTKHIKGCVDLENQKIIVNPKYVPSKDNKRIVDRPNLPIEYQMEKQISQVEIFKKNLKFDTLSDIESSNHSILEHLMEIFAKSLAVGNLDMTQEQFSELQEYIADTEKTVDQKLQEIDAQQQALQQEELKNKDNAQSQPKEVSKYTLDDTEKIF